MGILVNTAYTMLVEGKRRPYHGTVLQLGRQSILFSYNALAGLAAHVGFELHPTDVIDPDARLNDIQFFTALGFNEVLSMEYGTDEEASFVWDMNNLTDTDWDERFDFIYDGGTIEHIFHIPNALTNVCKMLKIGGRVVHDNGITGVVDHGFYAIQPTLYYDFYVANGFETNLFTVSKIELSKWLTHTGTQTEYVPGQYDYFNCFVLSDSHVHNAVCFVTKKQAFEAMVVPQQSIWARAAQAKASQSRAA